MLSNSSRNSLKSESALIGCTFTSRSSKQLEVVSKQATKVTAITTKLEWRIDQFEKLMKLFKNGHNLISKQFSSPQASTVIWELHVYPNGKRDEDCNNVSFFLRQVGLQRGEDPIMTEFQIYTLDANNCRISICRDTKDFSNQQGRGKFQVQRDKMLTALRPDGSLMLVCEVEYLPPGSKISVEQEDDCEVNEELANKNDQLLRDSLREMFENELFADCTIQCGTKSFMAHRCILGQHSLVFRSMFTQKTMLEAQNGTIHITDFRPDAVKAMLEYIYTGSISSPILENAAQGILAIADKYAIFPLKEHCERYLASVISKKNLTSMAVIADLYFANCLKKACTKFISAHYKTIIRSGEWRELKQMRGDLANELLESVLTADPEGVCAGHVEDSAEGCGRTVILPSYNNISGTSASSSFIYDSPNQMNNQLNFSISNNSSSLSSLLLNGSRNNLYIPTGSGSVPQGNLPNNNPVTNANVDTTADEQTPSIRKRLRRGGVAVAAASSSNASVNAVGNNSSFGLSPVVN